MIDHDRTNLADGIGGPPDPDVLFTEDEVARTLAAGSTIERAETVRRGVGEGRSPVDAVVVARRITAGT